MDLKQELIDQLIFDWDAFFVPRMEGLTDDEYLWEPVAETWSLREGADGTVVADWAWRPDPALFTTIAWRMWHMNQCFTERFMNHFGAGGFRMEDLPTPLTAAEGLAALTAAYERWRDALLAMPASRLAEPCGPAEGRYADAPFLTLVLHINREIIHHAAECCLIRDLYRQRESLKA